MAVAKPKRRAPTSAGNRLAAAVAALEEDSRLSAFDPTRPGSVPTPAQAEIIADFGKVPTQWVTASNRSGKSSTCAGLVARVAAGRQPGFVRPERWGNGPITIVIALATGKHVENMLLPKLTSYWREGEYRVLRQSGVVQGIEMIPSGNRIVIQSMENPSKARERLQGYTAHIAWVDEMPRSIGIVTELLMRVSLDGGFFLASFTPLMYSAELKKLVDSAELPNAKRYQLLMLDNPLMSDEEVRQRVLDEMSAYPEEERRARLYGEWLSPESAVFKIVPEMIAPSLPRDYSTRWRHVMSVDPATESAMGMSVWAECPTTRTWYNVLSEYIKDIHVPALLVRHAEGRVRDLNVVRRVCDSASPWYIHTARHETGAEYWPVDKKNTPGRKVGLIRNFQQMLYDRRIILVDGISDLLVDELTEVRWSDSSETPTIVRAQKYHLMDTAVYFADPAMIPPRSREQEPLTVENYDARLLEADDRRRAMEARQARSGTGRTNKSIVTWWKRAW